MIPKLVLVQIILRHELMMMVTSYSLTQSDFLNGGGGGGLVVE